MTILLLIILNVIPAIKEYNPITLASVNVNLITGDMGSSDVIKALWITFILIILSLFASIKFFEKKKI